MCIVPETYFNSLNSQSLNDKKEILSNIKRPVENAVYKSAVKMKHILEDDDLTPERKVSEHAEELNNFTILKDKMTVGKQNVPIENIPTIVDELPRTLQEHARRFLTRLKQNSFNWNENGGDNC